MHRSRTLLSLSMMLALFLAPGTYSFLSGKNVFGCSVLAAEAAPAESTDPAEMYATASVTDNDPYIRLNKKVFSFNDNLDRYFFEPVARGYDFVMPNVAIRGVTNFFNNLEEPRIVMNGLLQGKFGQAVGDTFRFLINTTVGIGGLFDVAKHAGLPRHEEDFGQTLAVWGAKESKYFVIPLLGPSSLRDTTGQVVDFFTYPLLYYHDATVKWAMYGLLLINRRANLLTATDVLSEAAGEDRYEFMRESYFQNRKNQIYDGNPPLDLPYMIDEPSGAAEPGGGVR
jgi:phospholipid-binding lipoprotein MlaA